MGDDLKIIIGGDIVPTSSNMADFERGKIRQLIDSEIMSLIDDADVCIFNLETPICDQVTPIEKEGPCFRTSVASVKGLKQLSPTIFTLANNHIMDQGEAGLKKTVSVLEQNGIAYTGVGCNIEKADSPYYIMIKNKRIGIYGCVEHEYSCATENMPGANAFDALETPDSIRKIKKNCDYLIVLYHGGKEYYEYPSPELQKRCHKLVDCGADFVICQHSHCVGTSEKYNNSRILYGQGNFIFDRYVKAYKYYFQTGLLVQITISAEKADWKFIPIKKAGKGIRIADKKETKEILDNIDQRSKRIKEPSFVQKHFEDYVSKIAFRDIMRMSRFGYVFSSLDNRFFNGKLFNRNLKRLLGRHQRLAIQNCLQCEVHNEVVRVYLDNCMKRK